MREAPEHILRKIVERLGQLLDALVVHREALSDLKIPDDGQATCRHKLPVCPVVADVRFDEPGACGGEEISDQDIVTGASLTSIERGFRWLSTITLRLATWRRPSRR